MGIAFEPSGVVTDLSQAFEHIDVEAHGLLAQHTQNYVGVALPEGTIAGVIVDIVLFATPSQGAAVGELAAAAVEGTSFATDLPADLVATGSWQSDQGFGGSHVAFREGRLVVFIQAFKTGATQLERPATRMAALILARIAGR